jgi:hypothetical protein
MKTEQGNIDKKESGIDAIECKDGIGVKGVEQHTQPHHEGAH